jgi:HK97 family phage prohead protease
METKRFDGIDVKAEASGTFEARISTFDTPDKYGDIVRRGAFTDTIARWRARGTKVPVVFAHQSEDIDQHVGEVDPQDLEETAVGLIARGKFYLSEPRAAKVHRQLLRKALSEWSYGFRILRAKAMGRGRELLALDLVELGPCVCGVGDTETIAVKSDARIDLHAEDRARIELARRRAEFALTVASYR